MEEQRLVQTHHREFRSDGIRRDGLLQLPAGSRPLQQRPVVVLCSGVQGLKELIPAQLWGAFTAAGYACCAFD
jgi:hypothetical protein